MESFLRSIGWVGLGHDDEAPAGVEWSADEGSGADQLDAIGGCQPEACLEVAEGGLEHGSEPLEGVEVALDLGLGLLRLVPVVEALRLIVLICSGVNGRLSRAATL